MDSMEDRLRTLATRGFRITLRVADEMFGPNKGEPKFEIDLTKGERYGGAGMTANGVGPSLDMATRSALRAAEAFLQDPEPPEAVIEALIDIGAPIIPAGRNLAHAASPAGRLAAEIEGHDPLRLANREKHREAALEGDRVRAGEDVGALSLT